MRAMAMCWSFGKVSPPSYYSSAGSMFFCRCSFLMLVWLALLPLVGSPPLVLLVRAPILIGRRSYRPCGCQVDAYQRGKRPPSRRFVLSPFAVKCRRWSVALRCSLASCSSFFVRKGFVILMFTRSRDINMTRTCATLRHISVT
jgi:hypothetical protein